MRHYFLTCRVIMAVNALGLSWVMLLFIFLRLCRLRVPCV